MARLPKYIDKAIVSGPKPKMRDWRKLPIAKLTRAEKVMKFGETYLRIGEGEHAGEPLRLAKFQEAFIYSLLDNPVHTRMGILSVARRNGKTFITAVLGIAALCGPLSHPNSVIASAALSREQASLIFRAMEQMIRYSPELQKITRVIPSSKRIVCLTNGAEYYALSAEANRNLGKSIKMLILDESGAIADPASDFVSALRTSQGSYSEPYFVTISTQSPSDAAYLSQEIDRAERDNDPATVTHIYRASENCALDDRSAWKEANPAIDEGFRSMEDIEEQAKKAIAIPAQESGFRNLILNQRVSQETLLLAPAVWKANSGEADYQAMIGYGVHLGLDLSLKNDLCVAVAASKDDEGIIHLHPYAFTPMANIEERSRLHRNPYDVWVRQGKLIGVPGSVVSYDWVCQYLRQELTESGILIRSIQFDRWMIESFKAAADRTEFARDAEWVPVGQGYKDASPRVTALETALLENRIRHSGHPIANLAAASCIVDTDPAGGRKINKARSHNKVDYLSAAIMAVYAWEFNQAAEFDVVSAFG